jgi:hypothetical protein
MQWNRSSAIGLALASCSQCGGEGMRVIRRGAAERPCDCVFRAIFRTCYNRFREFAAQGAEAGTVSLECTQGPTGYRVYSRKREEYMADFCVVSRRALGDQDYELFRYVFLLGADWRLCLRKLNMDRGEFFHHIYRMEKRLGRYYAEMEPYPLYPLDEYFGGSIRKQSIQARTAAVPVPRNPRLRLLLSA